LVVFGVGYLSIISASPSRSRPAPSTTRAHVCVRTPGSRRPDPCLRRGRTRSRCHRAPIARFLAALITVLAAAGAPSLASAGIPRGSGADISTERAAAAARSASVTRGITNATPANRPQLAVGGVAKRSETGTSSRVVSPRVPFAIPHSSRNALANRLISARKTFGSSPISRQINAQTSSAIRSSIRDGIDTKATTSTRSLQVRTRLATSSGRADVAAQQRESPADRRLMLQIGGALGLAYLGFLVVWFWATRLRPGPHRGARA
jgi:hypothetical protein